MKQSPMAWIGLCLVLIGLPLAVGSGVSWLGASSAMGAIAAGVCLVAVSVTLLTLSRRAAGESPGGERDTQSLQRRTPGHPSTGRRYYEETDGPSSAWAIAVVALALTGGVVGLTLFAMRDSGDDQRSDPDQIEPLGTSTARPSGTTSPAASQTPTRTPTSEPTVVAETPTQSPATPTPVPTQPPTATAAPQPQSQSQVSASLAGQWLITDVVETGQDAGSTYQFTVSFSQDGANFRGSGDGLVIDGVINGGAISASYTRPGGSGVFNWTLSANGSLDGEFRDFGAQNSGSSTLRRVG